MKNMEELLRRIQQYNSGDATRQEVFSVACGVYYSDPSSRYLIVKTLHAEADPRLSSLAVDFENLIGLSES